MGQFAGPMFQFAAAAANKSLSLESLKADQTRTHSKNICSFDTFDGQFGVQSFCEVRKVE